MSEAWEAIDLNETLHEYPTWEPGSANTFASESFEADFNNSDDLSFVSDESYTILCNLTVLKLRASQEAPSCTAAVNCPVS